MNSIVTAFTDNCTHCIVKIPPTNVTAELLNVYSLSWFSICSMAESQDLEQQCLTAFKQGNHDQAVQLLSQLQQPGDVTTEFNLYAKQELPTNRDVTLLSNTQVTMTTSNM